MTFYNQPSTSLRHTRNKTPISKVGQTEPKSLFWEPSVYQNLSTRHDWPPKKAIVDLPIRMKGNPKPTSDNSLSRLGAQNKYLGTVSQTLLTEYDYLCDAG